MCPVLEASGLEGGKGWGKNLQGHQPQSWLTFLDGPVGPGLPVEGRHPGGGGMPPVPMVLGAERGRSYGVGVVSDGGG